MFYEKNANALRRQPEIHQRLLNQLEHTQPTQDFELLPTSDGNYTLKYKGVFLHDPENPIQEVHNTLQEQCTPSSSRLHVILGLGLGYLLDETFKTSTGHIIVYEPDLELLRFILDNVDLSNSLGSGRVILTSTQLDLLPYTREKIYGQYQLDLLILKGSAFQLANEIPDLMEKLKTMEVNRLLDFKTGHYFHYQWMHQVFENYPYFAQYGTLDSVVGKFAGKPALVVSRGPSLDRAIDSVKALANSTVIIAVGGAIRRLWEAGIIPDFAVFLDANGMQEQLHGIPQTVLDQITFIICPFTQHCTFTTPSRGKLVFLSENITQYCDWLDDVLGTKHHRLAGGGTVSQFAFQTAMAMQCNPVILVGQDLAFPGNQVYAGGIPLQLNDEGHMALSCSETLFAAPEAMSTVLGQQGETLPTLNAYIGFIHQFEEMAAENARSSHPVALYNASLGGAKIEGYTLRDLSEFIPELPAWKHGHALPEAPILSNAEVEALQQKLLQGLRTLHNTLEQAITTYEKPLHKLKKALANRNHSMELLQAQYSVYRDFVRQYPLVDYLCLYEHIQFRQHLNTLTTQEALETDGCKALITMLSNCQTILREKALPWIEQAEATLQALQADIHCTL